jgi:hypothetical protein
MLQIVCHYIIDVGVIHVKFTYANYMDVTLLYIIIPDIKLKKKEKYINYLEKDCIYLIRESNFHINNNSV